VRRLISLMRMSSYFDRLSGITGHASSRSLTDKPVSQPSSLSWHLPELDGLRAIAVLLVVTAHMHSVIFYRLSGRLGVVIFFALSGFLITTLALNEERRYGSLFFDSFYVRRTFRIFPLYYFVLGIYCVLILGLGFAPQKKAAMMAVLPYYLTYLQEVPYFSKFAGTDLPFYQGWSLGIEEKFYLIWPAVCFLLLQKRPSLRIPAAILLGLAASASVYSRPYICILLGCILALSFQYPAFKRFFTLLGGFGSWIAFCLLAAFQFAVMPGRNSASSETIYAAAFCMLLAYLLAAPNSLNKVLATQPLPFIGKISYGIYLVHVLCISLLRGRLHIAGPLPTFLLVSVMSITMATFLHYVLEKPLIGFGRQISGRFQDMRMQKRAAAAISVSSVLAPDSSDAPQPIS
jgi:peptidoglycan/LPS O-acetylase OafA/YrhL